MLAQMMHLQIFHYYSTVSRTFIFLLSCCFNIAPEWNCSRVSRTLIYLLMPWLINMRSQNNIWKSDFPGLFEYTRIDGMGEDHVMKRSDDTPIAESRVSWYVIPDTMIRRYVVSENKAPWYANDTKKILECQKSTQQYWTDCFPLCNCSAAVYDQDAGNRRAVCGVALACQSLQSLQSTHLGFRVQIHPNLT